MITPHLLVETSYFANLIKKIWRGYCSCEQWFYGLLTDSYTFIIIAALWRKIKVYLENSFLGKISQTEGKDNSIILNESKFVRNLLQVLRIMNNKLKEFLKTSIFSQYKKNLKINLSSLPIKSLSIIMIIALLLNVSLFLLFNKKMTFYGWGMQCLLLFMSISGLFCSASWEEIKRTSLILRYINNRCLIRGSA
ncbi:MAG: hypothetical protein V1828_00635 [Candidatus Omnitrophota bacterium]